MAFVAESDPADDRLRLEGDCRMADTPVLARALSALRDAAPGKVRADLTQAGEFDIGPAWLLYRALGSPDAAAAASVIQGTPPEHFPFFAELPEVSAESEAAVPSEGWLIRFGRAVETRLGNTITSLGFGGRALLTAG